jgi:tetraacyldisaccharide 4'-kinase
MSRLVRSYLSFTRSGPQTSRGWALLVLLSPVSVLYGLFGWLRVRLYRLGVLSSFSTSTPVISVGNLAAGGKGKTPLVDYIVRYYLARGLQVAVVSRGYGGDSRERVTRVKQHVKSQQAAAHCGDEPVLLQRRNPQLEVLTAKRRADGIRYASDCLSADVIILDDGFQHLAASRALDIVMLDAEQPFGNGWPLPAGELREFAGAYRRADLLVLSRCSHKNRLPPDFHHQVIQTKHVLGSVALELTGRRVPLAELRPLKGVAFSGIAAPESFFMALKASGLTLVDELPLSDHVSYNRSLLKRLTALAEGADYLVTTEKDGVKLTAEMFLLPCYQIPLQLEFYAGEDVLKSSLDMIINRGSNMNLSADLLAILACPQCKGAVALNKERTGIVCPACKLLYPVRDDIPVMLIDEARPI